MCNLRIRWGMFAVMIALPLFGQVGTNAMTEYSGESVKMLASMRLEKANFYIYKPSFKAKGVYTSANEAMCRTPEELVISIQSETNQEWVHHNWIDGKGQIVTAAQFEKRKARDKNTNYFELIHKLTFLYNGVKTAIIKYWFVDDGKHTILANMIAQEKDGRWYRTNVAGLDHLSTVIMRVKSDYLASFFNLMPAGKEVSEEKTDETANLKTKIRMEVLGDQGVLDAENLFKKIMQLRDECKTNELYHFVDKSGS